MAPSVPANPAVDQASTDPATANAPPAPGAPVSNPSEPPTQPKRKRKQMEKGKRKNNKGWAEGVREEILRRHLAKYTEELAKSSQAAHEYGVKICHEFNYKIPYDLPDTEEPEGPLPNYDPMNPPPLPRLSPEEEKARSEALKIRNKRVMDWMYYRARKVSPAKPKNPMDDTFAVYMMRLCGMTGAPKKARQGWQQYQHENPAFCQASAQIAWEEEKSTDGSTLDAGSFGPEDIDEDDLSDDDEGAGSSSKPTKKTVNFISNHVRKMFNALPASERTALKERAQVAKAEEKAKWDEKLKAEPSQAPADVQEARLRLKSFLEPLLNGVHKRLADAHVVVLVGGRDPEEGGRVTVQHYSIGKNEQNTHFPGWRPRRFKKDVMGFFLEYLETVWDDEDCDKMALDRSPDTAAAGDVFSQAPHRFTNGEEDESDVDLGGEVDQRPSKRPRTAMDSAATTTQDGEADTDAAGGEVMSAPHGAAGEDDFLPIIPSSQEPTNNQSRRASSRLAQKGTNGRQNASASYNEAPNAPSAQGPPLAGAPASTLAPDLRGIPIDPALLMPPYTQAPGVQSTVAPETATASVSNIDPALSSAPATQMGSALSGPSMPTTTISTRRSSAAHAASPLLQGPATPSALPAYPADAPEWFAKALKLLGVDLGADWAILLHAWAKYEMARAYGSDQPQKMSRLDSAGCRPKEIADWIGKGRWRTTGCEPARKGGRFASTLMKGWWVWYVKLSPEWREEDEMGHLDDFTAFGEGNGKLDVPGVNGIFSLIAGLKWVGEAVLAEGEVYDRSVVEESWRRALRDLAKMLDGMVES